MASLINNKIVRLIFFGNYFYGLCAIALSIEAMLQQEFPLNRLLYFILVFAATVLYYSKAYVTTEVSNLNTDKRSAWYANNRILITRSQIVMIAIVLICCAIFIKQRYSQILSMHPFEWLMASAFPVIAVMYYGLDNARFANIHCEISAGSNPLLSGSFGRA